MHDGRLHPVLERALQAVHEPLAELRIERRATAASGWCDAQAAILLVPRGYDRFEVSPAIPSLLPDLVARLVELVPRPAAERVALTPAPGALAQAIAAPASGASGAGLPTVGDLWLMEATEPEGGPLIERLELLDTAEGLWRLEREQGSVRLEPTSPSGVWRRLTATVAAMVR